MGMWNAGSKKSRSSPAILDYLEAVDQWKTKTNNNDSSNANNDNSTSAGEGETQHTTNTCVVVTDNIHSLLKDVVNTKDDAFFASFASATTSAETKETLLHTIVKEKVCEELNKLYEEYTFDTAKDASITDNVRRELKAQRRKQQKQKQLEHDTTSNEQQQPPNNEEEELYQHSEDSLVYGEIDFLGFYTLLQTVLSLDKGNGKNGKSIGNGGGIFYDLGSGSGRAVFCARMICDFENCIGIELLPNLHQLSISIQSLYKFVYSYKLKNTKITFYNSDLLLPVNNTNTNENWWCNGTVIYIPNLLFDDKLMSSIAQKAIHLQSGSYIISLKLFHPKQQQQNSIQPPTSSTSSTRAPGIEDDSQLPPPSSPSSSSPLLFQDAFELIQQATVPMSWGNSTAYIYRRI